MCHSDDGMVQFYTDLIINLTNIRTNFFTTVQESRKKYPKIRKETDGRITFFSKSIVVIDSVTMCLIFADRHLSRNKWWTTSGHLYNLNPPPVELLRPIREGFKQFTLLSFFHFMFSAMENSIRLIARAIDSAKYEKMQGSFENIYSWLKMKLSLRKKYKKLMGIL